MSETSAVPPPEVVQAFISAAVTALQELTRVEAFLEPVPSSMFTPTPGPFVSAAIRLQRPVPGTMTLILCATTAAQLADRYLPKGTTLCEELIDDVAGEFANVIAGQAKTILKGTPYHFAMSPPVVSRAASFDQLPLVTEARYAAPLSSELGPILFLIDLLPCPNA